MYCNLQLLLSFPSQFCLHFPSYSSIPSLAEHLTPNTIHARYNLCVTIERNVQTEIAQELTYSQMTLYKDQTTCWISTSKLDVPCITLIFCVLNGTYMRKPRVKQDCIMMFIPKPTPSMYL